MVKDLMTRDVMFKDLIVKARLAFHSRMLE